MSELQNFKDIKRWWETKMHIWQKKTRELTKYLKQKYRCI